MYRNPNFGILQSAAVANHVVHSQGATSGQEMSQYISLFPDSSVTNQQTMTAAAAAAAKLLQSCPTLRPHRRQPTSCPGILQARTVEWVAISFSNA